MNMEILNRAEAVLMGGVLVLMFAAAQMTEVSAIPDRLGSTVILKIEKQVYEKSSHLSYERRSLMNSIP